MFAQKERGKGTKNGFASKSAYNERTLHALDLLNAVWKTQSLGTSVWQVTLEIVDLFALRDCDFKMVQDVFAVWTSQVGC